MKGGKALRMLARSPEVVFLNPPCALGGSIRGKSVGLLLLLGTCLEQALGESAAAAMTTSETKRPQYLWNWMRWSGVEWRGGRGRGGQTEERTTCFVRFSTASV